MGSYFSFDFGEDDFFNGNFIGEFEKYFQEIIKRAFQEFDFQGNPIEIDFQDNGQEKMQEERELLLENPEIGARVFHVPLSYLPHGSSWKALGIYVPYEHAIYIANNLPPRVEKFVYWHEVAHSLGIMDEKEADNFAAKKCGYYLNLGMPRGFILRY